MNRKMRGRVWQTVAIVALLSGSAGADPPNLDPVVELVNEANATRPVQELPVRIVDADGNPVAGAKVHPWALRCSQGHGPWREGDIASQLDPQDVVTDADGQATIRYPYYRDVEQQIRTTGVSLMVDHPEFAFTSGLHIDVPLLEEGPHKIELVRGVPLRVRPLIDDQPADLDNLFVLWSDGRSWRPENAPQKLPEGILEIAAMPPGTNSVLLVRLDGERATHFSRITDFELSPGETKRIDVPLRPALRLEGELSADVPRPVRNGRVKLRSLPPTVKPFERVSWATSAPVRPDGTFTIESWPEGEPLQLLALCDGYMATNGTAPPEVANPRDPKTDPFGRPQVFRPVAGERLEVPMTPLVPCVTTVVDEDEQPVAGVMVRSWPNVGWWNGGSQIYCNPLYRYEHLLGVRDYQDAIDEVFPYPYESETDAQGRATLYLPAGRERLAIHSEVYELPVFLGRRDLSIELKPDETAEVTVRLQPRGTDKLGEWDKLAGVVFGCSTREGRRICALPGVQKQMQQFAVRFREGKNQRDPQLLSEAYTLVAEAFANVGDATEAAKWRQKAAEQAELAKAADSAPNDE